MASHVSSDKSIAAQHLESHGDLDKSVAQQLENNANLSTRTTYVTPGLRGLFESKYVFICALFVCIGGFLFGYDQGVISIVLVMDQFLDRFHQVSETASGAGFYKGLMTAMIELGAFLGAFNMGWIADRLSRKYAIIVASVIFIVGSALQTGAVDYAMLVVSRLIGGVGVGMLSMVAPLYISEVSPQEIRGSLLVLEEFSIVFGIIVSYWITFGTRYMAGEWAYRLPFLLQIFPAILLGSAVFLLPFSPRWLAAQGRDDECLASLLRLRQVGRDDPRVQAEWLEIRAEVAFQREVMERRHPGLAAEKARGGLLTAIKLELAGYVACFRHGYAKRTMVGIMVSFFQQFVGINALIYYSPSLFETMGIDYELRLVLAGILNVTQIVGVVTSFYTLDAWGRRTLLLGGSAVMTVCHVVIAVLVGLYYNSWDTNVDKGWVSVAFLFIYMLAFGATWGPVPWALPSEIFPSSIRAHGVSWSTCSNWLNNFIIGLITPPLIQNTNGFGAYTFFAVFCLLSLLWAYFLVPETAGRSLEDMDAVFRDVSGAADEARKREILSGMAAEGPGGRRPSGDDA